MSFNITNALTRLSGEYISKIKYCDECFCEMWCIENGEKNGRTPHKGCEFNVIKNIEEIYKTDT